ncbi:hypothetical protein SK128_018628, partial [Halocaridina rubra]
VNLTCPEGYAFSDYNTSLTLQCQADSNWTSVDAYNIICRMITWEKPAAPNGSLDENVSPPYWEGTRLNYTCPTNSLSKSGENATSALFNGTGWIFDDPLFACFNVCGPPPTAESFVKNITNGAAGVEGDEIMFECLGGFETSVTNITTSCSATKWTPDVIPKCLMCPTDPPIAPATVSITDWNGIASYGANVTYTCHGKFKDGTSVVIVTCEEGNWTMDEIPVCI